MTTQVQSNATVAAHTLTRCFALRTYSDVVAARVQLGQQLRLSMQHPEAYSIPLNQQLPDDQPAEAVAQFVHPWNVACALVNLCLNASRFGGEDLAPQEDLQLYAAAWTPLGALSFPQCVVAMAPAAAPAPAQAPPAAPAPLPTAGTGEGASESQQQQAESTAPDLGPEQASAEAQPSGALPDPSIAKQRTGQSGRPQKSPFEKSIETRKKVAAQPFWWDHLRVSARKLFKQSPAAALDDSSSGAGPVQAYMVLIGLTRAMLDGVDGKVTVGELRTYLARVDEQVSDLPTEDAANQLRRAFLPANH